MSWTGLNLGSEEPSLFRLDVLIDADCPDRLIRISVPEALVHISPATMTAIVKGRAPQTIHQHIVNLANAGAIRGARYVLMLLNASFKPFARLYFIGPNLAP